MSDEHFLSRWSRRKAQAKVIAPEASPAPDARPASAAPAPIVPPAPSTEAALPPVESLTFESDFTAFLRPGVDEDLKRQAMRALVRDPRFNVMDGLDVYIDDYSKPDPLPEGWLEKMSQVTHLGDRPAREAAARAAAEAKAAQEGAEREGGAASAGDGPREAPVEAPLITSPSDTSGPGPEPSEVAQSRPESAGGG